MRFGEIWSESLYIQDLLPSIQQSQWQATMQPRASTPYVVLLAGGRPRCFGTKM
ncbi:unnamed protein product [Penicillium roqueforti FM164]|uniref:Genomic scaffold, ProqFM164S03 n=1 Tax=Penicillium roqueforti (strain FM164) TaxID=1365484 RepID=W6QK85_PENRF|nr:unnamed protein product [Penicillium roqueforti FM164]